MKRFVIYRELSYTIEVPDDVVVAVDADGNADAQALSDWLDANTKWPSMLDPDYEAPLSAISIDE